MPNATSLPNLDSELSTPLYAQLKLWFVDQIRAGRWIDEALPSERTLSETLNISRATVRQAISGLERDGWIEKKQGKGTFVAPPKVEQSLSRLSGFSENMRHAGRTPSSRLISCSFVKPSDELRRILDLSPDALVAVITRLRLADGIPLMLEHSHINSRLTPRLLEQDLTQSLYTILAETYGLNLAQGEESVEIRHADEQTASHLGISAGESLLYTQRLVTNEKGKPIEFAERFARADKCKFTVRLTGEQADFFVRDGF